MRSSIKVLMQCLVICDLIPWVDVFTYRRSDRRCPEGLDWVYGTDDRVLHLPMNLNKVDSCLANSEEFNKSLLAAVKDFSPQTSPTPAHFNQDDILVRRCHELLESCQRVVRLWAEVELPVVYRWWQEVAGSSVGASLTRLRAWYMIVLALHGDGV